MTNVLTFFGHASFQLTLQGGRTILVDPWLRGNPRCPASLKDLPAPDVLLITHGHEDHFDVEYVLSTSRARTRVIAPTPVRMFLMERGFDSSLLEPMNKGGTIRIVGAHVTMTHALHHAHISTESGAVWPHESAGYIVRSGALCMYFAGDTGIFSEMSLIRDVYAPTHAVLPIGDRYTMGPLEAAHAIRLLGATCVIPFHYDLMPSLTGSPTELERLTNDIPGLVVHALQPGDTLTLESFVEARS